MFIMVKTLSLQSRLRQRIWQPYKVNIAVFFLIFISTVVYVMYSNIDMMIGDAEWYLSIGDECFTGKGFNLLNFPKTFRGCLFPLYLQFIKRSILGARLGWAITSGMMLGFMFTFILPSLFGNINEKPRLLIGTVMAFVYIWIFRDTIAYTLSDVFATFFLFFGIWAALRVKKVDSKSGVITVSAISGACVYIAYNTRAVYLYGAVTAILVILFFSKMPWKKRVLFFMAFLAGVFIISVPQCIVNMNRENEFSARIYTENYNLIYGNAVNLQMQQIDWGLKYNRYGTYLGGREEYPSIPVYFVDVRAREILERESIFYGITIKRWLSLWLKYPLDMVGIYTGHIVSAMTPVFNRIYIYDLRVNNGLCICVSLIIWIVFFTSLLMQNRIELRDNRILIGIMAAIFVPPIMQSLGAVEVRFFLPGYFIAYGYVAYGIRYRELIKRIRPIAIQVLIVIVLISALWINSICDVLSNNAETVILVNNELMNVNVE